MCQRKYKTKQEILERGREAIGKHIGDISKNNSRRKGKGAIGNIIEESWFGYPVNNIAGPDFSEAGVELKVTPYIRTSKGIRAKERLVCNLINYMDAYQETFETSSFWHKCNSILIMLYEYQHDVPMDDCTIDQVFLFSFPDEDIPIIKNDWESITQKIRTGRAHEISESDTLYLAACTKGATSATMRKQPFSDLLAKQRAYSLKPSYMTSILRRYIFGNETDEHIIKDPAHLSKTSFVEYLQAQFTPYIGMSQRQLKERFHIVSSAKNINGIIASRILGLNEIQKSAEFKKANIKLKTIRLEADGNKIVESMPFPAFKFREIIDQEWEDSEAYEQFVEQKYLFIVFRKDEEYEKAGSDKEEHLFLDTIFLWQLPEEDEEEVRSLWEAVVSKVQDGVRLEVTASGHVNNDLPKKEDNRVAHVRPHASAAAYCFDNYRKGKARDMDELPDGRRITKHCFWLNNSYLMEQLKKHML